MKEAGTEALVERWFKLAMREKATRAEIERIKEKLKAEFIRTGSPVIDAGKYRARLITYERRVFDAKAFRAEHPKLYERFVEPQSVTKIEVEG